METTRTLSSTLLFSIALSGCGILHPCEWANLTAEQQASCDECMDWHGCPDDGGETGGDNDVPADFYMCYSPGDENVDPNTLHKECMPFTSAGWLDWQLYTDYDPSLGVPYTLETECSKAANYLCRIQPLQTVCSVCRGSAAPIYYDPEKVEYNLHAFSLVDHYSYDLQKWNRYFPSHWTNPAMTVPEFDQEHIKCPMGLECDWPSVECVCLCDVDADCLGTGEDEMICVSNRCFYTSETQQWPGQVGPIVYGLTQWGDGITIDDDRVFVTPEMFNEATLGAGLWDDGQRFDLMNTIDTDGDGVEDVAEVAVTACDERALCGFLGIDVGDFVRAPIDIASELDGGTSVPVEVFSPDGTSRTLHVAIQ